MIGPFECDGTICWSAGLSINADGASKCYAPKDRFDLEPLDDLRNAGRTLNGPWWALACDPAGIPFIQGPDDPAPGYYVSTTALEAHGYPESDPRRYVDSLTVPYLSIPHELRRKGVRLGDVAIAIHNGLRCGCVIGDLGPESRYGEGSIALAEALGVPSSPRTGGVSSGVSVVVWPGSRRGWPRPVTDFQRQADEAFAAFGGPTKLAEALAAWVQT